MNIQKILPKIKSNNFVKTAIVATALTLAPLTIANAQKVNSQEIQKDTIELAQDNTKERPMPLWKGLAMLFGSAIGMVGRALFCAWEPDNKNKPKS